MLSRFLSWVKGVPALVWLGIAAAILVLVTCASVKACVTAKGQRDAAYEVANRQIVLAHELNWRTVEYEAKARIAEAEARAQDERDAREVEDLYERVTVEGSAAGVLNDLIRAGELP